MKISALIKFTFQQIIYLVGHPILYSNYLKDFIKYKYFFETQNSSFPAYWRNFYPCIFDKTIETGFDRHYIYHTAWAARILKKVNPKVHIDISSSLYFVGITSAFIPIKFYDFRPADLQLNNLETKEGNLMNLPLKSNSVKSLSCMHVIEHIGLGRYGDPIDPEGDIKAIQELIRVLAPGGNLLFVVPTGKDRVMFNAHRIYSFNHIMKLFSTLKLRKFTLIPEDGRDGGLIENASPKQANSQSYGCGCYLFTK